MNASHASSDKDLVFLPLGGTGEIGMNCNLYGFGTAEAREWLMIDLGISFGDPRYPGIDVMMPDIGYIVEQKDRLHAIVLTHGHEDHIGAIAHLWPYLRCPVYATPFTLELVREKFQRKGIQPEDMLYVLEPDKPLQLGAFELAFMGLTHSIPEMYAIGIQTPVGRVLHTGDWKLDPDPGVGPSSDIKALKAFGAKGVQAMICDSTNALEEGHSGSEAQVRDALRATLTQCKGQRVFVSGFASNVARLKMIGEVAQADGRALAMLGHGMWRIYNAARASGYLPDFPDILSEREAAACAPDALLVLCTGSQGEPRAALMRLAQDRFADLRLGADDVVIFSSRVIPGNDIAVAALQNLLVTRGVRIIAASHEKDLHVSGHPYREELRQLYGLVRPQLAIPVHGEARHIAAHCALALAQGVPETQALRNGDVMRLAPGPAKKIGQVPHGRLHLDGTVLVNAHHSPAQLRATIAQEGLVHVFLTDGASGGAPHEPMVSLTGLPLHSKTGEPLEKVIRKTITDMSIGRKKFAARKSALKRSLARAIHAQCGKRPVIELFFQSL